MTGGGNPSQLMEVVKDAGCGDSQVKHEDQRNYLISVCGERCERRHLGNGGVANEGSINSSMGKSKVPEKENKEAKLHLENRWGRDRGTERKGWRPSRRQGQGQCSPVTVELSGLKVDIGE